VLAIILCDGQKAKMEPSGFASKGLVLLVAHATTASSESCFSDATS